MVRSRGSRLRVGSRGGVPPSSHRPGSTAGAITAAWSARRATVPAGTPSSSVLASSGAGVDPGARCVPSATSRSRSTGAAAPEAAAVAVGTSTGVSRNGTYGSGGVCQKGYVAMTTSRTAAAVPHAPRMRPSTLPRAPRLWNRWNLGPASSGFRAHAPPSPAGARSGDPPGPAIAARSPPRPDARPPRPAGRATRRADADRRGRALREEEELLAGREGFPGLHSRTMMIEIVEM